MNTMKKTHKQSYIDKVKNTLIKKSLIIFMQSETIITFCNNKNTSVSLEETDDKYIGLYCDSGSFQWVTFTEFDTWNFKYCSPSTNINDQIDERLAEYIWKYGESRTHD